ncbi:phage tail tape measure protein [Silvania hatchlandensis]|uniref:Phage tail tape measure protein n=1 Tax=Silvania hatchlandensis TaxID=2926469 RepID=A0A9J6Q4U2_9ENTR|nr:phage tail tape measure protein [Silvania hatchlandensis]MCU6666081.1 phage tail tape measure protein [Silvania hatchlandensis]
MSDQIASITLRADVSDLKTASNELDKLGQAAAGAVDKADDLNSVFRAGAESAKKGSEGLKEQQTALKGLLENIDPVNKALNRLDEQQAALRNFQAKGFLDTDSFQAYNKILEDTRLKLTDTGEAAARAQTELAATQAAEKQSAALKNLLGSIDPTIRAFSSLDEQHAQLVAHFESGRINSAQFEHFNSILNQTRERLSGVADVLPEALSRQEAAARRAGISVGQYSQAMRTLPAQFTDIATQLAGGQSPFLILLQQGGQIKDQFGGVKGAVTGVGDYLRTMISFVNPLTIGIASLAVGAGALAMAWYKGSQEASEFNRQLLLTGNYTGKTSADLANMAERIGGSAGKISAAAQAIAAALGTGAFKGNALESVAASAVAMQSTTGQAIDKTIADFKRLADDPVKASIALNEQYHYLTATIYDQIVALQKQGDATGAAKLAIDTYANTMKSRTTQIKENLGDIERLWKAIKDSAASAWDQMLNVGRQVTPEDTLKGLKERLKAQQETLNTLQNSAAASPDYGFGRQSANFQDAAAAQRRKDQEVLVASTRSQISALEKTLALESDISAAKGKAAEDNQRDLEASQRRNANLEQYETNAMKRAAELKKLAADRSRYSQADYQMVKAGIEKRYADAKIPKTPATKVDTGTRSLDSTNAETLSLQAQLKTLQDHRDLNDVISQQRKQQWELISKFSILDEASKARALSKDEQSLLSTKDRVLAQAEVNAGLGDQIAIQERLNRLQDSSQKYVTQMSEKTAALRDSAGLSGRQAQRLREEAQLRQGWLNGGGKLEDAGYEKELKALRNYYAEEDRLRGDWKAGALSGWNEYLEAATDTYSAVKSVAGSALTGLSDMLTDLMMTGKASIKAFGMSMLKMIAEVVNRLMVAYAVQAAMGWISGGASGGGSTPGGAYNNAASGIAFNAKGGVYESQGLSHYVNGVYDSPQYFTFQGASKFAKGGVFAEAGAEAIMPLTRDSAGRLGVRAQGGGGVAPVINTTINVDAGGSATAHTSSSGDAMGRVLAAEMQNAALQVVQKHLKPGGMIYNFTKGG